MLEHLKHVTLLLRNEDPKEQPAYSAIIEQFTNSMESLSSIKDWNELPSMIIESNNLQSFTTSIINYYNFVHA